jgi:hypothetical protein
MTILLLQACRDSRSEDVVREKSCFLGLLKKGRTNHHDICRSSFYPFRVSKSVLVQSIPMFIYFTGQMRGSNKYKLSTNRSIDHYLPGIVALFLSCGCIAYAMWHSSNISGIGPNDFILTRGGFMQNYCPDMYHKHVCSFNDFSLITSSVILLLILNILLQRSFQALSPIDLDC